MLPPVRQRTQMGDILSWAGGRARERNEGILNRQASAPEDSHPGEEVKSFKRNYGSISKGGVVPSVAPEPAGSSPSPSTRAGSENRGPPGNLITREIPTKNPRRDSRIEDAMRLEVERREQVNQGLHENLDALSKKLANEQQHQSQLASRNQEMQNQLFSMERVHHHELEVHGSSVYHHEIEVDGSSTLCSWMSVLS